MIDGEAQKLLKESEVTVDKRNQNRWFTIIISLLFVLLSAGCGDESGNASNGDVGSINELKKF